MQSKLIKTGLFWHEIALVSWKFSSKFATFSALFSPDPYAYRVSIIAFVGTVSSVDRLFLKSLT